MVNAQHLSKADDIKLHPLASYGAATNKLDVYGSDVSRGMTLGMFHAPTVGEQNIPLNFIGRKYIRAPLLGGLEYKPMTPNTSSQKIQDRDILHTEPVKRKFA